MSYRLSDGQSLGEWGGERMATALIESTAQRLAFSPLGHHEVFAWERSGGHKTTCPLDAAAFAAISLHCLRRPG